MGGPVGPPIFINPDIMQRTAAFLKSGIQSSILYFGLEPYILLECKPGLFFLIPLPPFHDLKLNLVLDSLLQVALNVLICARVHKCIHLCGSTDDTHCCEETYNLQWKHVLLRASIVLKVNHGIIIPTT